MKSQRINTDVFVLQQSVTACLDSPVWVPRNTPLSPPPPHASHELQITLQNSSCQPVEQLWLELEPRPGAAQLLSCRPEQLAQQLPLAAGQAAQLTVTVTAEHDFVLQTEEEEGG